MVIVLGLSLKLVVRPEKWEVIRVTPTGQVRFRFGVAIASGGRTLLLLGACWMHHASIMTNVGTSLLLGILHCSKGPKLRWVHFWQAHAARPCFRQAHCFIVQSLQFLTCTPPTLGGAEMTIIFSDNNSRILTAPQSDPLEGGRGVIVQNYCHCIPWEKATTIKMRLSKMLFFLCFRPTVKFQDGSPVDPLSEPSANPRFDSTSQNLFHRHFGVSDTFQQAVNPHF